MFSYWSLFNRRFSKLYEPRGTDVSSGSQVKAFCSVVLCPFGSVMKRKEEPLPCDTEWSISCSQMPVPIGKVSFNLFHRLRALWLSLAQLSCLWFNSLRQNDRIGEFLLGHCMLLCSIVFLTESYFSKHHCDYSTMISAVKCLSRVGYGASLVAFTIRTRTYEKKKQLKMTVVPKPPDK